MCKKSNWRGLVFCLSVLLLLMVINSSDSFAQTAGSAEIPCKIRRDCPEDRTPSSPSIDYTYTPPPQSYIPTSQAICDSFKKSPNYNGCYVQCQSYSQGKCTMMIVTFSVLLPYSKSETPSNLTFERRQGESDIDFFRRYNEATLDQLLKNGINVNSREAQAALLSAIANGEDEIASKFINAGTKIDYTQGGKVLLGLGELLPYESVRKSILQLIKLGVDINALIREEYDSGWYRRVTSSLTQAVKAGDLEIVKALLDAKVNLRPGSYKDSMPLLLAIDARGSKSRVELVKTLLAAGISPESVSRREDSEDDSINAIMLTGCDTLEDVEILRLLIGAGAKPDGEFYSHSQKKQISYIKYFKNQNCPYEKQVISLLKQAAAK